MIITLCGSTKFKEDFLKEAQRLTLEGHIILMPNVFGHADKVTLSYTQKMRLDELHKDKIMMSTAIFVINRNNYIGNSTQNEIRFAKTLGRHIDYLEQVR